MSRIVTGCLMLLLAGPPLQAGDKPKDKPATPAEQYQALEAKWQAAVQEFQKAFREAKNQAERQKVFQEKYPKNEEFAARFLELAEKNPKDTTALDALMWVVNYAPGFGAKNSPRERALEILTRDHVTSEKLAPVCSRLAFARDQATEKLLRAVLEKNPHRNVQGPACLALAQLLKQRGADKEAEQLFERAAQQYADLDSGRGKTIGELAQTNLFEIRHLAVGKPVPDIEGEDLDGKKFKLSDYHGKVVMLDFWGHW